MGRLSRTEAAVNCRFKAIAMADCLLAQIF